MLMKEWEKNIRRVIPYTPGEQPKESGIIKLNTNENPYPPSPAVIKALREMDGNELRRYPDPAGEPLLAAVAEEHGLSKDEVFVGVGSDDVLAMLFLTFFAGEKEILFPDITYSFYDVWAELFRIPYRQIPLTEDFRIRPEDYYIENGGVVIANPNAPTGVSVPLEELESIIRENQNSIVIIDEAYVDFGGETALPLIRKYDHLIITRTFSKSRSLAGMRIGAAFGNPELIRYLNDVKYSFNSYTMNAAAIAAGTAAIRDRAYFEETRDRIIATRKETAKELAALGFTFQVSDSNFLFVTHPSVDATELFSFLRERKIYVRHFKKPERIDSYLRITIGTDEEMKTFLSVVKVYMKERGVLS